MKSRFFNYAICLRKPHIKRTQLINGSRCIICFVFSSFPFPPRTPSLLSDSTHPAEWCFWSRAGSLKCLGHYFGCNAQTNCREWKPTATGTKWQALLSPLLTYLLVGRISEQPKPAARSNVIFCTAKWLPSSKNNLEQTQPQSGIILQINGLALLLGRCGGF